MTSKRTARVTSRTAARSRRDAVVQLRLLPSTDTDEEWVLDERTRSVGRQGVNQAREILRRSHPPRPVATRYSKAS